MSEIILKEYQHEAVSAVAQSIADKRKSLHKSMLIVLPTGTGKTVLMVAIAKQLLSTERILILVHRNELIEQTVDKFKTYWPNVDIGVCQGKQNDIHRQIVVGSIQTSSRPKRLRQLREQNFTAMYVDECHHAEAESYQLIIKKLKFRSRAKTLIGFTATPNRFDELSLQNTFKHIVYHKTISQMIKGNYLPPIICRKILTKVSLKNVKTTKDGDFDNYDLSKKINTPGRNALIVEKYKLYALGKKTLAFCSNIKHAIDLTSEFEKQGIIAKSIHGRLSAEQRANLLTDFKNGNIEVLVSVALLTEGYDLASINCILMARPTKSLSLYTQCIGRGLRPDDGKTNCLLLDFTDEYHNLNKIIALTTIIPESIVIDEPVAKSKPKNKQFVDELDVDLVTKEIQDREFDLFEDKLNYSWINLDGELSLSSDDGAEIIISPQHSGFIASLYIPYVQKPCILIDKPIDLKQCIHACESWAANNLNITFADLQWEEKARNQAPTNKQKEYIQSKKLRDITNKADATFAIRVDVARKKKYWRDKFVKNEILSGALR